MNCEMAEKNLSAYLDDMLDPQLHQEVAAHLESCAICSEVVAEYRRFDALLAETPRVSPPPELRDRIFSSPELAAAVRQQTESGDSASIAGTGTKSREVSYARLASAMDTHRPPKRRGFRHHRRIGPAVQAGFLPF